MSARPVVLFSLVALVASTPAFAQAPVVRSGECVYLYGAPPGEPAAATEEFRHGTRVYDLCTYPNDVQVGRDAPHRLTARATFATGPSPRGCLMAVWSEHEFVVEAEGPVLVSASAHGDAAGVMQASDSTNDISDILFRLDLQLVERLSDATERILAEVSALDRASLLNELHLDDSWGRTLEARAAPGQRLVVRLRMELDIRSLFNLADFGSPGSGRGVGYDAIEVCIQELKSSEGSDQLEDQIEQDLYEKRCLPSLWMPEANGGKLETAHDLVDDLLARAEATGDPGANVDVTRQRLDRASVERSRQQYQRACRSLSEAVRALTTP